MPLSGYFLPPSGKSLILLVVVSVKTAARSEVATVWCPKYCAAPARSRQGASPQCVGRAQRRLDRSGSVFLQARRRHVLGASWFYAATQLDAPSPEAKFAVESPLAQATAGSTCSAQSCRSAGSMYFIEADIRYPTSRYHRVSFAGIACQLCWMPLSQWPIKIIASPKLPESLFRHAFHQLMIARIISVAVAPEAIVPEFTVTSQPTPGQPEVVSVPHSWSRAAS